MDIFTTALTKVRSTPIKPEKLRVKSLKKEAAIKSLTDNENHLEEHELYSIEEKEKEKEKSDDNQSDSGGNSLQDDKDATEPLILHKEDITHPKNANKNTLADNDKHLDIFA